VERRALLKVRVSLRRAAVEGDASLPWGVRQILPLVAAVPEEGFCRVRTCGDAWSVVGSRPQTASTGSGWARVAGGVRKDVGRLC